ncbi:unnamed protein product [Adineta ricciae]|uniref:Uncharacterized protein n=1 Tax=Adineta ricciae TaxID=249248 RepID=A0A814KAZ8_ADIRI|nr:unnamed protein product [Adineta ricciae]CAF1048497.1 unnamed protein product [Adineta ricciae]
MTTENSTPRRGKKRSASNSPVYMEGVTTNNFNHLTTSDMSNDQDFLVSNEINSQTVGLISFLATKRLINLSFSTLYQRSLKISWSSLLTRERRNLKSNVHSVEKCFMLNRLISECTKDPCKFAQLTGELYEEIKKRMTTASFSTWSGEDFYNQVLLWRRLQCQRRLFNMHYGEVTRLESLLTLYQFVNKLCGQYLNSYRVNPTEENQNHLKKLLHYSFIIVTQPSIPECVAATKYEKTNDKYVAKLYSRVICLLDPELIATHFYLDDINVTLFPFDRKIDGFGESQPTLKWCQREVTDANDQKITFLYAELDSIMLQKLDIRNTRPLYSAKLCQIQFHSRIRTKTYNIEQNLTYLSEPFGLCSHAQYYPEYVAKAILYQVAQQVQPKESSIPSALITGYVARYYGKISGVAMKQHTYEYIEHVLRLAYEGRKDGQLAAPFSIYEDVLAQIISQMEVFIDHPFLSMMYHDGLFLGICNSAVDQCLRGTGEEPHILLRLNTLATHQPVQHASVRFIVHNGQLIRATFHGKAFVDEMCRMISEANLEKAKQIRVFSYENNRTFHDFITYFDNELFRLDTAAAPLKDAYQPFIPILWNTMRTNGDPKEEQSVCHTLQLEPQPVDMSHSKVSAMEIDISHPLVTNHQFLQTTEKMVARTDTVICRVVDKFIDLLMKSTKSSAAEASMHLLSLTETNQKELLAKILSECLQLHKCSEASTQTSTPSSNSNSSPCSTSSDN